MKFYMKPDFHLETDKRNKQDTMSEWVHQIWLNRLQHILTNTHTVSTSDTCRTPTAWGGQDATKRTMQIDLFFVSNSSANTPEIERGIS